MIDIEVHPYRNAPFDREGMTLPVLNPAPGVNQAIAWHAVQRDLYIIGPDQKVKFILNLDLFDPTPNLDTEVGNHFEYIKRYIRKAME